MKIFLKSMIFTFMFLPEQPLKTDLLPE